MNNNEESKVLNEEVLEGIAGGIENAVFGSVASTIENKLELPKGTVITSSSFADLSADSLDVVDIVKSIEDDFHVNFSDGQFNNDSTIGDLCKAIISKNKN